MAKKKRSILSQDQKNRMPTWMVWVLNVKHPIALVGNLLLPQKKSKGHLLQVLCIVLGAMIPNQNTTTTTTTTTTNNNNNNNNQGTPPDAMVPATPRARMLCPVPLPWRASAVRGLENGWICERENVGNGWKCLIPKKTPLKFNNCL